MDASEQRRRLVEAGHPAVTDPWSLQAEGPRALLCAAEIEHNQMITPRTVTRARIEDKSRKALDAHIAELHANGGHLQHYSTSAATSGDPPAGYHDLI